MAVVRGLFGATVIGGLVWAAPALAQTGTITGRVIDSTTTQPLNGVTVRLDGTTRGAQTREDGSFTLAAVPAGQQRLRVARVGFAATLRPVTVTAGQSVNVVIQLRQVATTLTEVVSIGYGTTSRAQATSAVATVNADQARVGVQPNVNQLIQGRAAGVTITQNSGDPGAGVQIRVRGGTSLSGGNEPLYVIDGVPIQNESNQVGQPGLVGSGALGRSPLNLLNPQDIADITILKDAAATAIYGSRGANGVVLIQTKKGAAGVSNLEYNGYVGSASVARKLDILSASQYSTFIKNQVALRQQDSTKGLAASVLGNLGTANTNWQDAILRTAFLQNHNASFSGGSQTTQYRGSVNYFDQPGTVIATGLTRYEGRL
ncbi:MAG: carboxypeptidase-like regulatory domain-containing protein, partial [Candidatus Eremiobacteraeota bacterium]|nr:carboxypeptidase-like regulatory domain-containing protein [Candidatus Eremiobacteraeota bacterium]